MPDEVKALQSRLWRTEREFVISAVVNKAMGIRNKKGLDHIHQHHLKPNRLEREVIKRFFARASIGPGDFGQVRTLLLGGRSEWLLWIGRVGAREMFGAMVQN
jgi:hypothetical protein